MITVEFKIMRYLINRNEPLSGVALMVLMMRLVGTIGLQPSSYPRMFAMVCMGLIGLSLSLRKDQFRLKKLDTEFINHGGFLRYFQLQ